MVAKGDPKKAFQVSHLDLCLVFRDLCLKFIHILGFTLFAASPRLVLDKTFQLQFE